MKSKIMFLALSFGKDAEEWNNETGDKRLFSNIYFMILEACEVMKKVDNVYSQVAFSNQVDKDVEYLQILRCRIKSDEYI